MVDQFTSWLGTEIKCAIMILDISGVGVVVRTVLLSSIHKMRTGSMNTDGAYSGWELRYWGALLRSPANA